MKSSGLSLTVVIATAFRDVELVKALASLATQARVPDEVIIVDGAPRPGVESLVAEQRSRLDLDIHYLWSSPPSAAVQRNVGIDHAAGDLILFLDDDAYPDADCLEKMVKVFEDDVARQIGGVGVLISNQPCNPPSARAKRWFDFLADEKRESYAGAVIGPAINIGAYPTSDGRLVAVEWLNTGCTAYRKEAISSERFCSKFFGYSFMEDVDLSVRVAKRWKLIVHSGASMYHDTKPSRFKVPFSRSKMSVCNRYHVMTESLNRRSWKSHGKFLVYFTVTWATALIRTRTAQELYSRILEFSGIVAGMLTILPAALGNLQSMKAIARPDLGAKH